LFVFFAFALFVVNNTVETAEALSTFENVQSITATVSPLIYAISDLTDLAKFCRPLFQLTKLFGTLGPIASTLFSLFLPSGPST
jgi:hypothetical protein